MAKKKRASSKNLKLPDEWWDDFKGGEADFWHILNKRQKKEKEWQRKKEAKMPSKVNWLYHLLGIAAVITSLLMSILVFSLIFIYGTAKFNEPNPIILSVELILMLFGLGYVVNQLILESGREKRKV